MRKPCKPCSSRERRAWASPAAPAPTFTIVVGVFLLIVVGPQDLLFLLRQVTLRVGRGASVLDLGSKKQHTCELGMDRRNRGSQETPLSSPCPANLQIMPTEY